MLGFERRPCNRIGGVNIGPRGSVRYRESISAFGLAIVVGVAQRKLAVMVVYAVCQVGLRHLFDR